jgi:SAM-dependent methyltransferase
MSSMPIQWDCYCPTTTTILKGGGIVCPYTTEFRRLATYLPSTALVMEIGCSYGKCTKVIAQQLDELEQVVGLDISNEVINAAAAANPGLKFVKSDALRDPMSTFFVYKELFELYNNKDSNHIHEMYVFVDIGGNRELESLVALLPWIEKELNPVSIIVKSETLYATVVERCNGKFDWGLLKEEMEAAIEKRKSSSSSHTGEEGKEGKETKGVVGKPEIKSLHPLKAPLRKSASGVAICRFHNYDIRGCRKYIDMTCSGETCPYDHDTCHQCLERGHIALDCTNKFSNPLI